MGWEKKGNNSYYYRKRREGKRVISEYVGAGPVAEMIALLDEEERQQREFERQQWRAERVADQELVKEIDGAVDLVRQVARLACIASGAHQHKRQWRYAANTTRNTRK